MLLAEQLHTSRFDVNSPWVIDVLGAKPGRTIVLVAVGLAGTAAVTYLAGGTMTVVPQLAHVFVVVGAIALGPLAGVGAGLTAGLLLGPAMPLNVGAGAAQNLESWLLRLGVFVVVGTVTGLLGRGLRETNRMFRETLDQLPIAVAAVTDTTPDATITYMNAASDSLLGDVTGRSLAQVFSSHRVQTMAGRPVERSDIAAAPEAIAGQGAPSQFEVTDAAGTRRVVQLRAVRAPSGQAVAMLEDVTALTQFENARRDLITLAGHHLRTPLTPLMGFSRLVADHGAATGDPTLRAYGAALERSAGRLHQLVERLTQLAQLTPARHHEYVPVVLREMAERIVCELEADELVHVGVPDSAVAHAVPSHVYSALWELLHNAVTHGRAPVRVECLERETQVGVLVEDAGGGLPDHVDPKDVLEPYAGVAADPQTEAPRGQGLGLALAAAHARATGGALRYDRHQDAFVLWLPAFGLFR